MVNAGASVQGQTANTATFVAREAGIGLAGSLLGAWAMGTDTMMATHTAMNTASQNGATLVATPGNGGTMVTLPDTGIVAANLLRFWFIANVLREPLANPLAQFKQSYSKMMIWNDRVELYSRVMFWKLQDTIHFDDATGVELEKRWIHVYAPASEIKFKAPMKEYAAQAKALIEERMAVHHAPSLRGGEATS